MPFFSRGELHSLVQPGLAWRTHDPIGLRTLPLGPRMINVLYRSIQLIFMAIGTTTIFRAPIRQNPTQRHLVFLKERHHIDH